jgi:membrane-associated phospholipid phosphatase
LARSFRLSLALAAAALVLFIWIAQHVLAGEAFSFDAPLRNAIHTIAWPPLTALVRGVTMLGAPAFLFFLTCIAVWHLVSQRRRADAIRLTLAGMGSEAINEALKLLFHRDRPSPFFGLHAPDSYSFPSGHAIASACFYITLAVIFRRSRIAAASLALAIGFSRIYLGVHYPSDVIAGFAAAVVWLIAIGNFSPGNSVSVPMRTLSLCLLASATAAFAQENPFTGFNKAGWAHVKMVMLRSAEKMPEENYKFRPADSVRNFGQLIGHVADAQNMFCSAAMGEKNPSLKIEDTVTSMADLIAALKEAFGRCDKAYY